MNEIALTARLLGALFYYSPKDARNSAVMDTFRCPDWQHDWPCGDREKIELAANGMVSGLQHNEKLCESWQRLFIGPGRLAAPPWGSVYLDKESVLFGDSTLALRQWMRSNYVIPQLDQPEPEDHFGLLMLLTSWCAENQPQGLNELLSMHLLSWADRYLDLLAGESEEVFYPSLAKLTQTTLQAWMTTGDWKIPARTLYF